MDLKAKTPVIPADQAEALCAVLRKAGLTPLREPQLKAILQNPASYSSGSTEWTEVFFGSRFWFFTGEDGKLQRVEIMNLHSSNAMSAEKLEALNAEANGLLK